MKKYIFIFLLLVSIFLFSTKVDASSGLISLNASGTDLDLVNDKYEYDVDYNGASGVLKIYADLREGYSFKEGYGPRTVNLNYGDNQILVIVLDENYVEQTYIINVFRKDDRVDNNYLKNIVVNGKALDFDIEKQVYSLSVNNTVDKLNIRVSLSDSKASYTITGNGNLVYGNNEIRIIVKGESGKEREYLLNVYKSSSKDIPLSSNTNLSLLKIEGYNIEFDSSNYEYRIMVKEEVSLRIKAMAEDENATVKIVGNRSIKHNGIVEIRVIAEDGSQSIYRIKVVVAGMSNIDIATIVMVIGSIGVIISTILVIIHLINKKKSNRDVMNFQVVRNEIPKIDIESVEDKQLMEFLLGEKNVTNSINQNANDVVVNNNGFNDNVKVCPYCGHVNDVSNNNCINCGNSLGEKL